MANPTQSNKDFKLQCRSISISVHMSIGTMETKKILTWNAGKGRELLKLLGLSALSTGLS